MSQGEKRGGFSPLIQEPSFTKHIRITNQSPHYQLCKTLSNPPLLISLHRQPPPQGNRKRLTRGEALEVRDRALRALKERLIARANILQSRYDEEQQFLLRKQANYQRDRDIITREEEEKYERECEDAMFRIKILESRLRRHEEESVAKYLALDERLRGDERLGALMEPDY